MQFSQCIGQQAVQQLFIQSANNERVHHAHILLSKPGGGGLPFALALAQYLNCENPSETDSCGNCHSCKMMGKLIHPDVNFTFPTVRQKNSNRPPVSADYIKEFREFAMQNPYGEEKDWLQRIDSGTRQGNITATECLEIIKSVKLKRLEGKYKINIIWKAELLAKEGNRLLKIIEEPPADTIFILVAEEEDLILNTILSRCQMTRLKPISEANMHDFLQKKGVPEGQIHQMSLLCDGNINLANELVNNIDGLNNLLLSDWLSCILQNKKELVRFVDKLGGNSKETIKNLLLHGTQLCREALILQDSSLPSKLNTAEEKIARWLGKHLNINQIHQLSEVFEAAHYAVGRNANMKLLLMSSSLKIDDIITQREVVST